MRKKIAHVKKSTLIDTNVFLLVTVVLNYLTDVNQNYVLKFYKRLSLVC